MKKAFVQYFKTKGFRINTRKGEAFKKIGELHYFLRLFEDTDFDGNASMYFKFGVIINSPFEPSYWLFENSVYLDEFCYGGERSDSWSVADFQMLVSKAESIGLAWIIKHQDLDVLSQHILWRIDNGIRWYEPPQFRRDAGQLHPAGQDIVNLFGGPGDKICYEWVKRMYKPLAIVRNVHGDKCGAMKYMSLYLEHISQEHFRKNEINTIQRSLSDRFWPGNGHSS
tara:strand:- start:47 stop:724 length:678 start_codon:yes stop_codon:yes gene_type:complete